MALVDAERNKYAPSWRRHLAVKIIDFAQASDQPPNGKIGAFDMRPFMRRAKTQLRRVAAAPWRSSVPIRAFRPATPDVVKSRRHEKVALRIIQFGTCPIVDNGTGTGTGTITHVFWPENPPSQFSGTLQGEAGILEVRGRRSEVRKIAKKNESP